jgi:hypothetical protein
VKRVRHYLSRLATLDVSNMRAVASQVARESGRSSARILADMVWCSIIYQAGYLDYQEFEFYSLSARQRRTWITSGNANSIVVKYNQRAFRELFFDKVKFNERFARWLGRDWLDIRSASTAELEAFLRGHGTIMAKQLSGMSGAGIRKVSSAEVEDVASLRETLVAGGQYLLEAFISQHPAMAALNPSSVNSLRMITFFDGDRVHVLEAVLRMGNGADVDNYGRGGMYTVIDETTGVAPFAAFDKHANAFPAHPITGTPIVGFRVPLYDEVLALLDEVGRVVPEIPYVGWDVAIGEDAPLVIEGNYNTGVFQMKPSLTGSKIGLLPKFRAVIDF